MIERRTERETFGLITNETDRMREMFGWITNERKREEEEIRREEEK